ncbi:hypothetical protein AV530_016694 [Patagioenas fasciata monilis]|uniref:Uncharacterized protein n=1 Tax=Patagioenas fasciata monilis TaxID=372326 RepID=A0A1V4J3B5_PATFA|nr:hypothetical protein AV530_016694 [Patagioenas fasciata monilis]
MLPAADQSTFSVLHCFEPLIFSSLDLVYSRKKRKCNLIGTVKYSPIKLRDQLKINKVTTGLTQSGILGLLK